MRAELEAELNETVRRRKMFQAAEELLQEKHEVGKELHYVVRNINVLTNLVVALGRKEEALRHVLEHL